MTSREQCAAGAERPVWTRRRFLSSAAALAPATALISSARAQTSPTINVKNAGASGNGKQTDLQHVRAAIEQAIARGKPATVFFPRGEYFLGSADNSYLLGISKAQGLRLTGEQAVISCRSVNGQSSMLVLAGCRNMTVEGLTFYDYGLNRDVNWLGAGAIRLTNEGHAACENIEIRDCAFRSVMNAVACRTFETASRCTGITLDNLSVSRSYYGFVFQDNGDRLSGRRLRCEDVKRSYFPYGVSTHDVDLETYNNTTGFTDVLIKCYHNDTTGLRVKVKCRGKRGGDAIVALDQQHESGRGSISNVSVELDVDDVDCGLDTVVLVRSFDPRGSVERKTANRWDEITLDGTAEICARTKLIDIVTTGSVPGRLHLGPRLARHTRLPAQFPGFIVVQKP